MMKRLGSFLIACLVACGVVSAQNLRTESDSLSYSVGMMIASSMKEMIDTRTIPAIKKDLKELFNESVFYNGVIAYLRNDSCVMKSDSALYYFNRKITALKEPQAAEARKVGEDFLKKNAQQKGVKVLPSGLQYKVLEKGKGPVPGKNDTCTVKYEGRLIDGTVFDSSYKRNPQTIDFTPSQVIKGWTEALTMMPVGSKWQIFIPENLAYGERGAGDIPPYSTLIFEVELVSIKHSADGKR